MQVPEIRSTSSSSARTRRYVTAIRAHSSGSSGGSSNRLSRRHLSQLGLHPDQGVAALGRDLPLHAAPEGLYGLSAENVSYDPAAVVKRSRSGVEAAPMTVSAF